MDTIYNAHALVERSGGGAPDPTRPPIFKVVGLCLAIASGVFIGTSFVLKKVGLLKANEKYNEVAGEGYGYLRNWYWWGGMTLMIVGEICNFVAYAFVDAILVTPLGALSVVVTTILSAIFLKERLSFVGKVGCFNCIIGSVVIVLNAPTQSAVADIQGMQHFVISPGFLSYAGIVILACTFIAVWAGPRYGKKSMLVYLSICSLIGGLSVVATQGLGSAIIAQIGGKPQFNQWFLYVLLVFVITTLLTEIIYLNKALNLYNAALVTPTYYVFFTSATITTSAILFRGFKGTPISITTVVMGFFQICAGVILLQLSKSSKDIPDAAVFKGDLDQIRQVGQQEQSETDPKADAIRGAAALVRRFSSARQKMEAKEFERLHQEKMQDQLEPLGENEVVEWDGLRRRKTVVGDNPVNTLVRTKTIHPPLGMSDFPDEDGDEESAKHTGAFTNVRSRASTLFSFRRQQSPTPESTIRPVPLTEMLVEHAKDDRADPDSSQEEPEHTFGLPKTLKKSRNRTLWSPRSKPLPPDPEVPPQNGMLSPPSSARRQWSFSNLMARYRSPSHTDGSGDATLPSQIDVAGRGNTFSDEKKIPKHATEEERLGLVKGDSAPGFHESSPDHPPVYPYPIHAHSHAHSTSTSSTSSQDDQEMSGRARLLTSSDPKKHYSRTAPESDLKMENQMTDHHDTNTFSPRTVTIKEPAASTSHMTPRSIVTPPPDVALPYSFQRRETRNREQRSPPPTYRQVQAQTTTQESVRSQPQEQMQNWPIPAPSQRPSKYPQEGHRIQEADPVQVPDVTSQAQRGRVLERGSVQIVQVFDRSRSSSMSRSRTRKRGENSRTRNTTRIEKVNDNALQLTQEQNSIIRGQGLGDFIFERPITLHVDEGIGSPVRRGFTSPITRHQPSPEVVDTNSNETKDRFQEQSRREREKRRLRMSSGANGAGAGSAA